MGLTRGRSISGIGRALLGFLVVFPIVIGCGFLLENLYNAIGYKHPLSHDLLTAIKGEQNVGMKALQIFGAAIVAPAFEEYLFRGHIQTALVRLFGPRSIARVWLAILVTSVLFAGVHPAWMAPLIFVLALCLGYAYERTGNLWVPIVIHACFNTLETILFLRFM
jgi:membrane protease YdiL (CAAX protease family)